MMLDRLVAVPRKRLSQRIGALSSEEIRALNRSLSMRETCTP
jgi:hypothetical protein